MITEEPTDIDPALAKDMLGLNGANWRHPNRSAVAMLAEDMRAGRWVEGTGTIDFTEDGQLGDGQHRLMAVVESGVTIRFTVRRNVPQAVIEQMDTGRKRNFSDLLVHRGEANATTLAAMVLMHYRWAHETTGHGGYRHPTHSMLSEWLRAHPTMREFPKLGSSLRRAIGLKATVGATAIYELSRIDYDEALAFHGAVATGKNLAEDSAVLALRRQVIRAAASRYRTDAFDDLAITVKAWNGWLMGAPTKLLVYRRGGSKPEPFPKPIDLEGKPSEVR